MSTIRCLACADVGQVAIFHDAAVAGGVPQWLIDATEDALPLPLILNCPKCGRGKVNVSAATSFVDLDTGFHLEHEEAAE